MGLFCDSCTKRYFYRSVEKIHIIEAQLNGRHEEGDTGGKEDMTLSTLSSYKILQGEGRTREIINFL